MRNNEAAIIALSKSQSQFFNKDTDNLVDNEAVIVYDERTALWILWEKCYIVINFRIIILNFFISSFIKDFVIQFFQSDVYLINELLILLYPFSF